MARHVTAQGQDKTAWLIRPLQTGDLPAVMEIERQGYSSPWSERIFHDCFRPEYQLWALQLQDRVIGYAVVAALFDEAHLLNLCVEPSCRSGGAGRYLLRHLIKEAFALGMNRVLLEVRLFNEKAIGLYESEGFRQIGMRPGYYSAPGDREDALVLALEAGSDVADA